MIQAITTGEIALSVDSSAMTMRFAVPTGAGRHPAVLVCHHREGVDDFTRYVLMRLAEIGLIAVAPNFYHRRPADEDPIASMKILDDGEVLRDIAVAVAHLKAMPSVRPDRIATVGHCLGGRTSFLGLTHEPALGAGVLLYHGNIFEARGGDQLAPFTLTHKIRGPLLGLFQG